MSDMVKNTLLWLVVIGILVLVFSGFDQSSEPDNLNYSEFVTAVSENQVAVSSPSPCSCLPPFLAFD